MKHFNFPADAFIGYIRICRPGSVLGPQQQYLCSIQTKIFSLGENHRKKYDITDQVILDLDNLTISEDKLIMNSVDIEIAKNGQKKQGKSLVDKKK